MSKLKSKIAAVFTALAVFITVMFSVTAMPEQKAYAKSGLVISVDYDIETDPDQWYTTDDIEFYADGILVYCNGEDVTSTAYIKFNSVPSEVYDGVNEYYNIPIRAEYKDYEVESYIVVRITGKPISGDVSENKRVDLQDAIIIAEYLLRSVEFTDEQMKVSDYNGDGNVDLYDVIDIAKYLLN